MANQHDPVIPEKTVRLIRSSLKSSYQLANELGLDPSTVRKIRRRQRRVARPDYD